MDDADIRCSLNPDVPKVNEHLTNIVRSFCHDTKVEKTTVIDSLGTHIVEGIPLFFAGDRVIWSAGLEEEKRPKISWKSLHDTRLVIDPSYSEQEADEGMEQIIDLSHEVGRSIFALKTMNIFREAFMKSGITPRSIVFVHGLTGVKKTTYSNFQSHIYNRDQILESPPRFNASIPAAVNLLYEKNDCVVVYDDLFPAQDRSIHKHQEKVLLEITRVIGDGIEPARMRGHKVAKKPPRCGVLFTGEYSIGGGSDAARMLPIKMTVPIDNDALSACQREPLMLSTFYHNFIEWYITNFDKVCRLLKEWISAYRNTKTGVHDRLQETQFLLEAAYKLYLTYRTEKGFIAKEDALELYQSFYQQLRHNIKEQNARVERSQGVANDFDYLALLRTMCSERRFSLVQNIKDFEAKEHDGVIHKDHLYIRRDNLMKKIKLYEPSADFDDILKRLKDQRALKTGKNSNSRQLGGGRGMRFYAIKIEKLK